MTADEYLPCTKCGRPLDEHVGIGLPCPEVRPSKTESDPCEKCGAPVHGYVAEYCCDGRECGCMGRALSPCWCDKCWADYDADAKRRAAEFANVMEMRRRG